MFVMFRTDCYDSQKKSAFSKQFLDYHYLDSQKLFQKAKIWVFGLGYVIP